MYGENIPLSKVYPFPLCHWHFYGLFCLISLVFSCSCKSWLLPANEERECSPLFTTFLQKLISAFTNGKIVMCGRPGRLFLPLGSVSRICLSFPRCCFKEMWRLLKTSFLLRWLETQFQCFTCCPCPCFCCFRLGS